MLAIVICLDHGGDHGYSLASRDQQPTVSAMLLAARTGLVIGASSGLGAALARRCAAPERHWRSSAAILRAWLLAALPPRLADRALRPRATTG
jgi:hypothetical protein